MLADYFRGGPTREPVEAAVGAGDVAISACRDMDDDLSFLCRSAQDIGARSDARTNSNNGSPSFG